MATLLFSMWQTWQSGDEIILKWTMRRSRSRYRCRSKMNRMISITQFYKVHSKLAWKLQRTTLHKWSTKWR